MTKESRKQASEKAVSLRNDMVQLGLWPCCLNCEHWRQYVEYDGAPNGPTIDEMRCTKFNIRPPVETIVIGCLHHSPDIPF